MKIETYEAEAGTVQFSVYVPTPPAVVTVGGTQVRAEGYRVDVGATSGHVETYVSAVGPRVSGGEVVCGLVSISGIPPEVESVRAAIHRRISGGGAKISDDELRRQVQAARSVYLGS